MYRRALEGKEKAGEVQGRASMLSHHRGIAMTVTEVVYLVCLN